VVQQDGRRGDCSVWPKAQEFGFPNEEAALRAYGHGIGRPIGKAGDQRWFRWNIRMRSSREWCCAGDILAFDGRMERRAY